MPDQTPSMPTLPEPDSYCTHADSHEYDVWNADQMHAYAQAVADERVRAALAELRECRDLLSAVETTSRNNFAQLSAERIEAIDAAISTLSLEG